MGRYTGTPVQLPVQTQLVPVGGITSVLRSGASYKAIGEVVSRTAFSELSDAFPRNGAFSSVAQSSALPASQVWLSIASGAGVLVAVGAGDNFAVSADGGRSWVPYPAPASGYSWACVKFANNLFVAVSQKSGGSNVVATSVDGKTWVSRTISTSAMWSSVAYGAGLWVAVASYDSTGAGTCTIAASSPDGITWTARTLPTSANWTSVEFNGSIFLAISASTAAASSSNGTSWTARTLPVAGGSGSQVSLGASGVFVLCLGAAGLITTPDAVTFMQRVLPSGYSPTSAAYGDGVHVVMCNADTKALVSYDGASWTQKVSASIGGGAVAGVYSAGQFTFLRAGSSQSLAQVYAENLTNSDYLYLSGTAGQFIRAK